MPTSQRPTLVQALAVMIPGIVITLLSAARATANFADIESGPSLVPMFTLFAGAALFAVGGMMTVVVLVRPLFGKRPQDARSDAARPGGERTH